MTDNSWPILVLEEWQDTYATLHMWTQVVGKIRLAQTPLVNHWWNVPLYVAAAVYFAGMLCWLAIDPVTPIGRRAQRKQ